MTLFSKEPCKHPHQSAGNNCVFCGEVIRATDPAAKVKADLETILREAEKAGTLNVLPKVAIYFTEIELRTIVHALSASSATH